PRYVQVLIVTLIAIALSVVFYVFYLKGALEERDALRVEVQKLEKSVAEATAIANQLAQFKRELAELEARLNTLRSILPAAKETPMVLRSVQEMAVASGLKIMKFSPSPIVPRAFYVDWPIGLTVEGNYDGLGHFFERVSQFTRIINVENIAIKAAVDGSMDTNRTVSATCTATTFVFRESEVGATGGETAKAPNTAKTPNTAKAPNTKTRTR
ncbi:MAG TPA: type 4a pilus biogenesis protein PilO, partial [Acidobacteriota bacterium]|nr:type 4a pilus biogenesis protein PilO [Acidobacteriota bacterium]